MLRYEVSVSICSDTKCWVNEPFPCGYFPEHAIFAFYLSERLNAKENFIADKGYFGSHVVDALDGDVDRV